LLQIGNDYPALQTTIELEMMTMSQNDFDWQEQIRRNQELDKWRMMNEQTDLLREMSGKKSRASGIKNWDWPLIGWCLLIFAIGTPFAIWLGLNV
jgi:hypothetical protein